MTGVGEAGDDYDREPRARRDDDSRRMIDDDEGAKTDTRGSDAGAAGIL